MVIRKEFRVESAHIVRNCTSKRCSHSVHGHSAVIEVFLESRHLDNAQMVYDFGLLKGTVKQFIDSMDHCYLLCSKDAPDFKAFMKRENDRWIEMPFNPSAEMLSVFLFKNIRDIIRRTVTANGEQAVSVKAVRYHETTTGYAEADAQDVDRLWDENWKVEYSDGVREDWSKDLVSVMNGEFVANPRIEQQINLK